MRLIKSFPLLFCLILSQFGAKAQYPTDYSFESYKIKEGLSQGGANTVFQDHLVIKFSRPA